MSGTTTKAVVVGLWGMLVLSGQGLADRVSTHRVRVEGTDGRPGEEVEVSFVADLSLNTLVVSFQIHYDPERLELREARTGRDMASDPTIQALVGDRRDGPEGLERRTGSIFARHPAFLPAGDGLHLMTLVFRVRGSASSGPTAITIHAIDALLSDESVIPFDSENEMLVREERLSITVLPADGPRAPDRFECARGFRSILLEWSNTEAYEALEIRRAGKLLVTLPGDAEGWEDPDAPRGDLEYRISSVARGVTSHGTACRVYFPGPTLPAPRGLGFEDLGSSILLYWSSPLLYDQVLVFRNQAHLASLAGDVERFEDPLPLTDPTLYSVIGVQEEVESNPTQTLARALRPYRYRIPETLVEPGSAIRLPILATVSHSFSGFSCVVEIDTEWLDPTSCEPNHEYLTRLGPYIGAWSIQSDGAVTAYTLAVAFFTGGNPIPALFEEPIAWVEYTVRPEAPVGTETVLEFGTFQKIGSTSKNLISGRDHSGMGLIVGSPHLIHGRVRVRSPLEPQGLVGGLLDCSSDDGRVVTLHWSFAGRADRLVLERDGEPLVNLPATENTYVDTPGPGRHLYRVLGTLGGERQFASCQVLVGGPTRFLRGDVDDDGQRTMADVMLIVHYIARPIRRIRCLDAADVDDSGYIDYFDIVWLLREIFQEVHLPPGQTYDRASDTLPCPSE